MSAKFADCNKEIQDNKDMNSFENFKKMKQNGVEKDFHIITGMHFFMENLLALADFGTFTVHVFDTNSHENLSSIRLDKSPYDICSMGDNKLVTTHDEQLLILCYDEKRKILDVEKVKYIKNDARGIVKSGSELLVTCVSPQPCIRFYSTELIFISQINFHKDECYPLSVEVSGNVIIMADSETHSVKALTKEGHLIWVHNFESEPISLAKDEVGCIFVALACDRNIHKINPDGSIFKDVVCLPKAEIGLLAIAYCVHPYCIAGSDESGKNIILHTSTLKTIILKITNPKEYVYTDNGLPHTQAPQLDLFIHASCHYYPFG